MNRWFGERIPGYPFSRGTGCLLIVFGIVGGIALWLYRDAHCTKRGGVYLRRDEACVAPPPGASR